MPDKLGQVVSYGVSSATAGVGFAMPAVEVGFTLADAGIVAGIVGVLVRAYIDISRHLDRKCGVERRKNNRSPQ